MEFHEIQFRVRYAETDQMGFVHHANYLVYFEMGRVELLRSKGLSYRDLEAEGFLLVVVQASCKYYRPARYDDLLTLRTRVVRVTPARIEHHYQLFRDGELLAEGQTTLACVDRAGNVQRIPAILWPQGGEAATK
jgi:acyl-CoA thioester hydrolase